jgi:phosphoglycolate phosphatase
MNLLEKKQYSNLIFDFDGVIADTSALMFDSLNYAFSKTKIKTVNQNEFKSKSKIEIVRTRNIGKIKILLIVFFAKKYIHKNVNKIKLFDPVIKLISEYPGTVYIVSSNAKKNILIALGKNKGLFKKIYADVSHNKKHVILKKFHKDSAYITDEVRDVEECKKANIDVYGVTWGLDNKKQLLKSNPNKVFEEFEELKIFC